MAYRVTDNIQSWIRSAIDDQYNSLDDDEKLEHTERVTDYDGLRQECEDIFNRLIDQYASDIFMVAIMNTIDFKKLLEDIEEDIKESDQDSENN